MLRERRREKKLVGHELPIGSHQKQGALRTGYADFSRQTSPSNSGLAQRVAYRSSSIPLMIWSGSWTRLACRT